MAGLITADRVLSQGTGQCPDCKQQVTRVLVHDSRIAANRWYLVHWDGKAWREHECEDAPPLKEAA